MLHPMFTPPARNGLAASHWQLPPADHPTVFEALVAQFAGIAAAEWQSRFERGLVLGDDGRPLTLDAPYRRGARIHYYREVTAEPRIPFAARVLYADAHLLVAEKPHFLPVTPAGRYAEETLLTRLVQLTGNDQLAPLHRIDRTTAGLVLFSVNPATRARYQALFRERHIRKHYDAIAPALPTLSFPYTHRSRLVEGEPFFRMQEVSGAPNSETRIEVIERGSTHWRYALAPVTGKKHQLRVHLAAIGAPIVNDELYPELRLQTEEDYRAPLQLLAKSLAFTDPTSGTLRRFVSEQQLAPPG